MNTSGRRRSVRAADGAGARLVGVITTDDANPIRFSGVGSTVAVTRIGERVNALRLRTESWVVTESPAFRTWALSGVRATDDIIVPSVITKRRMTFSRWVKAE